MTTDASADGPSPLWASGWPGPMSPPKRPGAALYGADITLPGMLVGRILMSPHAHARVLEDRCLQGQGSSRRGRGHHLRRRAQARLHPLGDGRGPAPVRVRGREPGSVHPVRQGPVHRATGSPRSRRSTCTRPSGRSISSRWSTRCFRRCSIPRRRSEPGRRSSTTAGRTTWPRSSTTPSTGATSMQALAASAHVVEFSGRNSRQKQAHMEPDVAVASWDAAGRLTVWSPSQNAHLAKKAMACRVFDIGEGDVRWITPVVGGGFGARLSFGVEPVAAMLAKVAGKPVKVVVTREEDFSGWNCRTEQRQTIKMGVADDGTINRHRAADRLRRRRLLLAQRHDQRRQHAVDARSACARRWCAGKATMVYTNNPTSSGMRGYGNPEGSFILQQAVDMAAEKCGHGPGRVPPQERQRNGGAQHVGAADPHQLRSARMHQSAVRRPSAGRTSGGAGESRRRAATGAEWACRS